MKPEKFAAVLRGERPEAVAITLSQLPPRFAADVLAQLPEDQRVAAVQISRAPKPRPVGGLEAIMRAVEQSVNSSPVTEDVDRKAAAKRAAAVLNQLDSENAAAIIEHLRAGDREGAALIEARDVPVSRLPQTRQSRACRRCLPRCRPERLARALKGITDEERAVIFGALTEQVRTVVEAEIAESGPVPAREVKAARREIIDLAMQMDREGRIRIRAEAGPDGLMSLSYSKSPPPWSQHRAPVRHLAGLFVLLGVLLPASCAGAATNRRDPYMWRLATPMCRPTC